MLYRIHRTFKCTVELPCRHIVTQLQTTDAISTIALLVELKSTNQNKTSAQVNPSIIMIETVSVLASWLKLFDDTPAKFFCDDFMFIVTMNRSPMMPLYISSGIVLRPEDTMRCRYFHHLMSNGMMISKCFWET